MTLDTNGTTPTRRAQDKAAANPVKPARSDAGQSGAVVQFVAARAHGIADSLYALAKQRIDQAQRSATPMRVETLWQRTQPILVRAGEFVRDHPLRAGTIIALLAAATLLARSAQTAPR